MFPLYHNSGVTWASRCLKSMATQLLVKQLARSNKWENIKAPYHWPFVRGIPIWPITKGSVMRKAFPWRTVIMRCHVRSPDVVRLHIMPLWWLHDMWCIKWWILFLLQKTVLSLTHSPPGKGRCHDINKIMMMMIIIIIIIVVTIIIIMIMIWYYYYYYYY